MLKFPWKISHLRNVSESLWKLKAPYGIYEPSSSSSDGNEKFFLFLSPFFLDSLSLSLSCSRHKHSYFLHTSLRNNKSSDKKHFAGAMRKFAERKIPTRNPLSPLKSHSSFSSAEFPSKFNFKGFCMTEKIVVPLAKLNSTSTKKKKKKKDLKLFINFLLHPIIRQPLASSFPIHMCTLYSLSLFHPSFNIKFIYQSQHGIVPTWRRYSTENEIKKIIRYGKSIDVMRNGYFRYEKITLSVLSRHISCHLGWSLNEWGGQKRGEAVRV